MSRSRFRLVFGPFVLLAALAACIGLARRTEPRAIAYPPAVQSRNDFGRVVSLELTASPFPHESRKEGYSYEGGFYAYDGHYDDPRVSVFIPEGFEPRGSVDLVFFFHGWYSSVPEAARYFDLFQQFSASGAKALLVLPELARDAPDSSGGKLEEEGSFTALVRELLDRLHAEKLAPRLRAGRITLVGHSGAYHVISRILDQTGMASKVEKVVLFDALYEDLQRYADWISAGRGRFVSICAVEGDPADNARDLAAGLRQRGVRVEMAKDDPNEDARVLGHRVVFLSSPYDHSGLVCRDGEFRRVLAAGFSSR
jgi:hypothetical protein